MAHENFHAALKRIYNLSVFFHQNILVHILCVYYVSLCHLYFLSSIAFFLKMALLAYILDCFPGRFFDMYAKEKFRQSVSGNEYAMDKWMNYFPARHFYWSSQFVPRVCNLLVLSEMYSKTDNDGRTRQFLFTKPN